MSSIAELLSWARQLLVTSSRTPLLDSDVLLAHALKVSRSYLLAFPERKLTEEEINLFKTLVKQRDNGMPIAYITGHREFWSLDFLVTPAVLIPRPETELLVERVLQQIKGENKLIADLGTGSGAIALSIAHEKSSWKIYATDRSKEALKIAKQNAMRMNIFHIIFCQGEWCHALPSIQLDAIISNPPYIAPDDIHLQQKELSYEPQQALIAEEKGLKDIREIIEQARHYLKPGGTLFLEHGASQASQVQSVFADAGYVSIQTHLDLAGLDRMTEGLWTK